MRNIKILGLALVAMFSMSAVMAVSASADTLKAQAYPAQLTGTAEPEFKDVFTTTAGTVTCPDSKYDATIGANVLTGASVSVTPTYPATGCTGFGFPAVIHHNSCSYQFKVLAGTAGTVNLACSGSDEMTITAVSAGVTKCTVHVKPQTDIPGTVKYTNIAGGITLEVNLTGIHYTHTQGSGIGSCPSGTGTTGSLVAKATISAESDDGKNTPTTLVLN
jgi:hypothetical protein